MVGHINEQALSSRFTALDATRVPVLDPLHSLGIKSGALWLIDGIIELLIEFMERCRACVQGRATSVPRGICRCSARGGCRREARTRCKGRRDER